MNPDNRQLTDRLQSAYRIEMTDETRRRQLSSISVALKESPSVAPVAVPLLVRWRTRLAAFVVATSVLTPAAVAVAAESSLPGDVLYPVKQMTEDMRAVVDSTVVARHRLDEADAMLEHGYPMDEVDAVLVEAEVAIAVAGDHSDLRSQLTDMRDHMGTDAADPARNGVPHDESTPPRGDVDEMRDGDGSPMTGETPQGDGVYEDRSDATHDGSGNGSDMGTGDRDMGSDSGSGGTDMGSNSGTGDSDMGSDVGSGDSDMGDMGSDMGTDTGSESTVTDTTSPSGGTDTGSEGWQEDQADTGSFEQTPSTTMPGDAWNDSSHDWNG